MRRIMVILVVLAVLMSCGSFPKNPEQLAKKIIFWNEDIPKEQCVGLLISPGLTITSYNGVSVNWKEYTMVYLPAGNVTFTMDVDYYYGTTIYHDENWPFQWTFNPGDLRYLMGFERDGEPIILVGNGNDETKWMEQPAYKIPLREGTLILQ